MLADTRVAPLRNSWMLGWQEEKCHQQSEFASINELKSFVGRMAWPDDTGLEVTWVDERQAGDEITVTCTPVEVAAWDPRQAVLPGRNKRLNQPNTVGLPVHKGLRTPTAQMPLTTEDANQAANAEKQAARTALLDAIATATRNAIKAGVMSTTAAAKLEALAFSAISSQDAKSKSRQPTRWAPRLKSWLGRNSCLVR